MKSKRVIARWWITHAWVELRVLAGIFLHLGYCRPPENLTVTMVTASSPQHKTYINHMAYTLCNTPNVTKVSMKTYHIDGNRFLFLFRDLESKYRAWRIRNEYNRMESRRKDYTSLATEGGGSRLECLNSSHSRVSIITRDTVWTTSWHIVIRTRNFLLW